MVCADDHCLPCKQIWRFRRDCGAEDRLKRNWFSLMMNYFDTGIKAVESQKEEISFDEIIRRLPDDEANEIKVDVLKTLRDEPVMFRVNDFIYSLKKDKHGDIISTKMVLNHGNEMDLFEYADESDGTKRLFHLIPLFYESEEESTVLIDEIELLEEYIQLREQDDKDMFLDLPEEFKRQNEGIYSIGRGKANDLP